MKTASMVVGGVAALVVLFVLVPAEKVDARAGAYTGDYSTAYRDERPSKSGLRIAIEGRLRWLGL